jgi:cytoskeleton protein RodZ
MIGIGQLLRQAREEKQLSLADVERETKIRVRYLEALETENFGLLPGTVYMFGFVRSYASFLGLDAEEVISRLKKEYQSEQEVQVETKPVRNTVSYNSRTRNIGKLFKFLAVVLGICLILGYFYSYFLNRAPVDSPTDPAPVSDQLPVEPVVPETEEQIEEVIQGIELEIAVVDQPGARCWVEVRTDGEPDFSGILEAGEVRTVVATETVWLKIGNAGVLSIIYNGEDLGYLGSPGEVLTMEFPMATGDTNSQ